MSQPLFSILTPVYEPPEDVLRACIESVLAQTLGDWELVLVDDCSASEGVREVLRDYAAADARIKVGFRSVNGGIVAATNECIERASGQFMALLDNDDLLAPRALETVASVLADDVDLVYTDEDKTEDGRSFFDAFRKPDWSPERLRSQMYVGHLGVYRSDLVRRLGGFRAGFEGSQDYDLCLRVSERARRIVHLPEVLYHWRVLGTSVASDALAKPYAYDAARSALTEHLQRVGIGGEVEMILPGCYRTRRGLEGQPLVSIIIPTRGGSGRVRGVTRCFVVEAVRGIIERSTYPNYELVVVADGVTPEHVIAELKAIAGDRLRLVPYPRPFNFSDKINLGALNACGEHLLLLNDDVDLITADWIETMLGLSQQVDVGMVGAKLYFEDDTIQHMGHHYWKREASHIGLGDPRRSYGYFSQYLIDCEVSGATAACAMVRKDVFVQVGGFSTSLPVNFNDVDFSLKVRGTGRRIVATPHVELYHFESKTRVARVLSYEVDAMNRRWGRLMVEDSYWRHPLAADHARGG